MPQLKIKNFGPIIDGYKDSDDGFFEVKNLTVFIGEQGSGKSCVAKLYSTLSWLEKKIAQNSEENITKEIFEKQCLDFHKIRAFVKEETQIIYKGEFCTISYGYDDFSIKLRDERDEYTQPKILYVPAERNFCSSVTNPAKVNFLPANLVYFMSDYYDALSNQHEESVLLPLNGYAVEYNNETNDVYVSDKTKNYKIGIQSASSGLQSLIPMYISIRFFINQLSRPLEERFNEFSSEQTNKIRVFSKELLDSQKITEEKLNKVFADIEDSLKNIWKTSSEQKIKKLVDSRFLCIIEEPEQNLFPQSQYEVINALISLIFQEDSNKCFITTHSPYILETINNCLYANDVASKGIDVSKILPKAQHLSYGKVAAYKISDGNIYSIKEDDIKQINPGEIDKCSQIISDIYTKLSDAKYGELGE